MLREYELVEVDEVLREYDVPPLLLLLLLVPAAELWPLLLPLVVVVAVFPAPSVLWQEEL